MPQHASVLRSQQRLLALAESGEGVFKFLRGGYGCGKTFMARLAVLDAQARGFATSFVVVSDNDLHFYKFDDVYRKVVQELGTASCRRGALGDVDRVGQVPPGDRTESGARGILRSDEEVVPAFQDQGRIGRLRCGRAAGDQRPQQDDPGTHRATSHDLLDGLFGGQRYPLGWFTFNGDQHRDTNAAVSLAGQQLLQLHRLAAPLPYQRGRCRGTAEPGVADPHERVQQSGRRVVGQHGSDVLAVIRGHHQYRQRGQPRGRGQNVPPSGIAT